MTNNQKIEALKTISFNGYNERFHDDYSGRGMYGETCAAIYTDDANWVIEQASEAGIKGARTDSMGLGAVVYWPSIKTNLKETT